MLGVPLSHELLCKILHSQGVVNGAYCVEETFSHL